MKKQSKDVKNRPTSSGRDSKEYFRPKSKKELKEILKNNDILTIIAGGTDLLVSNYQKLYKIDKWLDLDLIDEFKEVKIFDDKIEIGSMVTHDRLVRLEKIKELFPILHSAALDLGSPQIRSRGTIGGNIVTSSPAGDLLPPLLVYDAEVVIISDQEERKVDLNTFFTGPKKNVLKEGEILEKIVIPLKKDKSRGVWKKVGKRKALVISSISLALNIVFDKDNIIKKAKMAIGSAAPVPLRIKSAEEILIGQSLDSIDYIKVAKAAAKQISPIDDIRGTAEYRISVAKNITKSALKEVTK
ncbi:MAG: xanthine dehydrogenase family protein subunit M [Halanaerobiales bacterium]|nr:xanthine dehydrogenase family protein subunit M [Halanaerobiales bacterium]